MQASKEDKDSVRGWKLRDEMGLKEGDGLMEENRDMKI